jgi:pyruvate dehydrogenase E1 component alpha subunit
VSFIFLGDGAIEEGSFYESANFAAVHKLPAVFVVENNLYSVYTGLIPRQPGGRSISKLASAIGLYCDSVDDSDFLDSYSKFLSASEHARSGRGPSLIEINTYRKLEHCGPNDDDNLGYRPKEELSALKDKDLVTELRDNLSLSAEDLASIEIEIQSEIDEAFEFAESSPFPTYEQATGGVYAD